MSCLTLSWNWWNFTWSATFWTRVLLVRFPNFPSWNLASYWITTAYRGSFRCWRTLVTYLVWPRSLECAIGASPHRFLHRQANRSLLLWFSALCLCSLQRAPLLLRENATLRGCARSCSPFLLLSPTQVCTTYPGFGVAGRYGCKSTNGPTVFFSVCSFLLGHMQCRVERWVCCFALEEGLDGTTFPEAARYT